MITALISFICFALASAIAAGAFVYGRQIGYTKRDAEVKAEEAKALQSDLEQLTMGYQQLEMQYTREQQDNARNREVPIGWDPENLDGRR